MMPVYENGGDGTAFLLPFLGQVAAVKAAVDVIAPNLFIGPAPAAPTPYTYSDGMITPGQTAAVYGSGPVTGMELAVPGLGVDTIPKTLKHWLIRIAQQYGPSVAAAVWQEFQKRRRAGQSSALAKASLDESYPVRVKVIRGKRRMNPTNVRALRRALRRVRSFKRVTRKVKGLGLGSRRASYYSPRPRRRRRGDLWDVEDQADMIDEAEDLGYEPDFFGDGEDE